ncbi:MAG TPA: DUF3866 family protein [Actinomycetales bacterium]|nr:DUF3866 family protein [Actinomycetales bacterium]
MITWRGGTVLSVGDSWAGAITVSVRLDKPLPNVDLPGDVPALVYPALVGQPRVGARVVLNVSALARGLGTGGYALVVAFPDDLPDDPPAGPGHLVKARYTPLQAMVLGIDEQESPHHEALRAADSLGGLPVVVADLHSALPAVIAGARLVDPQLRISYVMTDGGALPAWFSRSIGALREAEWLETVITVGQAFGGDHEAVSLHSGLLAAHHVLGADLVVVAQGPGNLGTGTAWGFSGVAAGEAINAVGALEGRPIATLRVSGADQRARHRGISHHSLTAYSRVALASATVVVPDLRTARPYPAAEIDDSAIAGLHELAGQVEQEVAQLIAPIGRHARADMGVDDLFRALHSTPVRLSTMGRGLAQDPASFLAAAAAGKYAALQVRSRP